MRARRGQQPGPVWELLSRRPGLHKMELEQSPSPPRSDARTMFNIRPATVFELPAVNALFRDTFPVISRSRRHYAICRQKGVFVAIHGGRVAGFGIAWAPDRNVLWLDYLGVHQGMQGLGVGK